MSIVAKELGFLASAEELARAGSAFALAIDHRPLLARLAIDASDIAYQNGQLLKARDLAARGFELASAGAPCCTWSMVRRRRAWA